MVFLGQLHGVLWAAKGQWAPSFQVNIAQTSVNIKTSGFPVGPLPI
jgi:hypothetical protein